MPASLLKDQLLRAQLLDSLDCHTDGVSGAFSNGLPWKHTSSFPSDEVRNIIIGEDHTRRSKLTSFVEAPLQMPNGRGARLSSQKASAFLSPVAADSQDFVAAHSSIRHRRSINATSLTEDSPPADKDTGSGGGERTNDQGSGGGERTNDQGGGEGSGGGGGEGTKDKGSGGGGGEGSGTKEGEGTNDKGSGGGGSEGSGTKGPPEYDVAGNTYRTAKQLYDMCMRSTTLPYNYCKQTLLSKVEGKTSPRSTPPDREIQSIDDLSMLEGRNDTEFKAIANSLKNDSRKDHYLFNLFKAKMLQCKCKGKENKLCTPPTPPRPEILDPRREYADWYSENDETKKDTPEAFTGQDPGDTDYDHCIFGNPTGWDHSDRGCTKETFGGNVCDQSRECKTCYRKQEVKFLETDMQLPPGRDNEHKCHGDSGLGSGCDVIRLTTRCEPKNPGPEDKCMTKAEAEKA